MKTWVTARGRGGYANGKRADYRGAGVTSDLATTLPNQKLFKGKEVAPRGFAAVHQAIGSLD